MSSPLVSYRTLEYTSSLSLVLDEDEKWQGIKCARESEPHRVHRSIARESRGWPRMSRTLTIAFPTRVLRWGYLSQGKLVFHQLCSFHTPSSSLSIRKTRENLELHVVSHRHGHPRPASTPMPLGEGLQDQLPPPPTRSYMSVHPGC